MATNNAIDSPLAGTTGTGNFVGSTSPTITTPKIAQINDPTNNLDVLQIGSAASSVNFVAISATATTVAPVIAAEGSDTNIDLDLAGKGTGGPALLGSTSGTGAASGYVGQVASSLVPFGSAVSITTTVAKNITSMSIPAGDWDVWGSVGVNSTGAISVMYGGISTTTATLPDQSLQCFSDNVGSAAAYVTQAAPQQIVNSSGSTTVYLVTNTTGTGTLTAFGTVYARRRR